MRILALETSGRSGSFALLEVEPTGGLVLNREVDLPGDQRTAQCLAPALKHALASAGWEPSTLGVVAVTHGPGSFTGLRIGVTTAKTLAYVTGAKLVGVSTLAAIASQSGVSGGRIWAVLDAQRGELFTQVYAADADFAHAPDETQILSVEGWVQQQQPGDLVTGPILSKIGRKVLPGVQLAADELWKPTARAVGQLGWRRFTAGLFDDIWQFVPRYYRRSAAEEKWKTIQGGTP